MLLAGDLLLVLLLLGAGGDFGAGLLLAVGTPSRASTVPFEGSGSSMRFNFVAVVLSAGVVPSAAAATVGLEGSLVAARDESSPFLRFTSSSFSAEALLFGTVSAAG